jgi:hypothetical protein
VAWATRYSIKIPWIELEPQIRPFVHQFWNHPKSSNDMHLLKNKFIWLWKKIITNWTTNERQKTEKIPPLDQQKNCASMVGGMFAITIMNCWRKRFIVVGTRFRSLGTVPWYAMAACNAACDDNDYGINWIRDLSDAQNPWRMLLIDIQCFIMHITS